MDDHSPDRRCRALGLTHVLDYLEMAGTVTVTDRYACSRIAHEQACKAMPGGVNSPVRAYHAVGCQPITIRKGKGAFVTDIDGNSYIDYVASYGPLILGHAPETVLAAVSKALNHGTSFGMPTEAETSLARAVLDAVPSIEVVRFVNSGTEAVMSAIRLARAATGRSKVIKCIGCYHGHSDGVLVQAGSGATTFGIPSSPGVPESITRHTLLLPFNDVGAARQLLSQAGDDVACFVIEPVAGNMGCIPPVEGYLTAVRELCDQIGAILIFDEVMTGFRVAYGGAQQRYDVQPDLTCLGKIIGGGLPCAAYGGRDDLMRQVAPDGPVYQAGTLSGNPLAMTAGLATLESLQEDNDVYARLEQSSATLAKGLEQAATKAGVPICINRVGSMLTCFFNVNPVKNYADAVACDTQLFALFFRSMLANGVVLPPSQFECWFVSTAHAKDCIATTLEAANTAFDEVAHACSSA